MEWISVKDRLPLKGRKDTGRLVCIVYGFDPTIIHQEKWVLEAYYDSIRDCFEYGEYDCPLEVTHWMPLPEPPKEIESVLHSIECDCQECLDKWKKISL